MHCYIGEADFLNLCAALGQVSQRGRIGKHPASVFGLRRIPQRLVEVAIAESVNWSEPPFFVSIHERQGAFGGSTVRICVRAADQKYPQDIPHLALITRDSGPTSSIEVGDDKKSHWARAWPALRDTVDHPEGIARIVQWHAAKYFPADALDPGEVDAIAAEIIAQTDASYSLADVNRLASRALYRTCYNAGWRKLTVKQRARYGWQDRAQWQRAEACAARAAELRGFRATGCGDATHDAAAGHAEGWENFADDEE